MNVEGKLDLCRLSLCERYRTTTVPNLNKKYRSHIEIMGLILESVKDNNAPQYSIMKHVGINYSLLGKYLESLTEMGFVERSIREGRVLYRGSEKGLAFLRQYYVLLGMLLSISTPRNQADLMYRIECNGSKNQNQSPMKIAPYMRHIP